MAVLKKVYCKRSDMFLSAEELLEDVEYILNRNHEFDFELRLKYRQNNEWWYRRNGSSSDSIFRIAYRTDTLDNQSFPSDASDLAACENTFNNLPEHRKTLDAYRARNRARDYLLKNKGKSKLNEVVEKTQSIIWHQSTK